LVADQGEILRNWILRKPKTKKMKKKIKTPKTLKPYLSIDISECASSVDAEAKLTQLPIALRHESLAFLARSLGPKWRSSQRGREREKEREMRGKIEEESRKIEVVARRNPKTQENARVGGSRCRSQRVGPKRKNL
jgi:hypothetical protein